MIWIALIILILLFLGFDMLVLHKKNKPVTNKRVAIETIFWVSVAFLFSGAVYWLYDTGQVMHPSTRNSSDAFLKYITGYLIELSLSVDNLFVIAMIFASFKIPLINQHKVLFWGILGAIILRGVTIGIGVVLIEKVSWMTYLFGAFLLFTAFKMLKDEDNGEEKKYGNRIRKIFKISNSHDGEKFWVMQDGIRMATPLFAALVMIELTDLLFALDSIPAILAVSSDPFIVFSSNIFAILGLRSMYFFLASMLEKFHYLKYSVFAILVFVAIKLLIVHIFSFPEWISLVFIGTSLLMGVLVSLNKQEK